MICEKWNTRFHTSDGLKKEPLVKRENWRQSCHRASEVVKFYLNRTISQQKNVSGKYMYCTCFVDSFFHVSQNMYLFSLSPLRGIVVCEPCYCVRGVTVGNTALALSVYYCTHRNSVLDFWLDQISVLSHQLPVSTWTSCKLLLLLTVIFINCS